MSAFDTVPPDVDEITNWRDFRFKDRAIDYTLLRGDAMLDLSEYDTRRAQAFLSMRAATTKCSPSLRGTCWHRGSGSIAEVTGNARPI